MDTARAQSFLGEALLRIDRAAEAAELLNQAQRILAAGNGWRERVTRQENETRLKQLRLVKRP